MWVYLRVRCECVNTVIGFPCVSECLNFMVDVSQLRCVYGITFLIFNRLTGIWKLMSVGLSWVCICAPVWVHLDMVIWLSECFTVLLWRRECTRGCRCVSVSLNVSESVGMLGWVNVEHVLWISEWYMFKFIPECADICIDVSMFI